MNSVAFVFTFVVLSSLILPSALAKNLKIEEISVDLRAIQVTALKERKNILQEKQLFSKYDTFIENGDRFMRFYIVNIQRDNYKHILEEVRKKHPDAFGASEKIKKIVQGDSTDTLVLKKVAREKRASIGTHFLNSKTILKTRKKFF